MEVSYVVIIALVTYVLGAFTKLKVDSVPNKYIPLQNVIIGVVSALVCIITKVEPNILQAFVLCLVASTGAGGVADLVNPNNYKENK